MEISIKEYCKKKKISEAELGRRFGVTRNIIYDRNKAGYMLETRKGKLRMIKVVGEVDI